MSKKMTLNLVGVNVQGVRDKISSRGFASGNALCDSLCAVLLGDATVATVASAISVSSTFDISKESASHQSVPDSRSSIGGLNAIGSLSIVDDVPGAAVVSSDDRMEEAPLATSDVGFANPSASSGKFLEIISGTLPALSKRATEHGKAIELGGVTGSKSATSASAAPYDIVFTTAPSTRCDWCRREVSVRVGVPIGYEFTFDGRHIFTMFGTTCHLRCSLAVARHESLLPVQHRHGPRYYEHLVQLFYKLCRPDSNGVLQASPDWRLLQHNGGSMTVEQYFGSLENIRIVQSIVVQYAAQTVSATIPALSSA